MESKAVGWLGDMPEKKGQAKSKENLPAETLPQKYQLETLSRSRVQLLDVGFSNRTSSLENARNFQRL
jgi:hypothetical protein